MSSQDRDSQHPAPPAEHQDLPARDGEDAIRGGGIGTSPTGPRGISGDGVDQDDVVRARVPGRLEFPNL